VLVGQSESLYVADCLTLRTQLRTVWLKEILMSTLSASEARSGLYRLIDQAAESHEPVVITGKRSNAVLVSEEDWSAIQETLYLLAVPGMRESIKETLAEPLAKSKRTLKW
jgi:antitoxin YefM